jgi:Ni/Co efflux regulator RcnB
MPRAALRLATLALWAVFTTTSLLPAAPASAEPPGHAKKEMGNGKQAGDRRPNKGGHDHHGSSRGDNLSISISIGDNDRMIVRDYYGGLIARGHCPPGLAKKNNGCMPPGQAKKWAIGRPLPRDVIFYDLPHDLSIRLSVPPQGYKYVRVAADILMIAVGTGLVVGAIEDLGRIG